MCIEFVSVLFISKLVELSRIEVVRDPGLTSRVQRRRSPILSKRFTVLLLHYQKLVELSRIELLTSCVQGRRSPS